MFRADHFYPNSKIDLTILDLSLEWTGMFRRTLHDFILKDLAKKMVFVGGPRQTGKTILARQILESFPYQSKRRGLYTNWDLDADRQRIIKKSWSDEEEVVVFDELHKFPRWKNWIKGVFDSERDVRRFLVTGSARLDVYRRGGDSLMGRYHYWRLHPFTLSEIPDGISPADAFKRLMTVGGFPEPFLDNNEAEARRWRKERFDKVLRDDIRDLEPLRDLVPLSLFVDSLRKRVGQMIVLDNIVQELQVSHKTLKHWLEVLERMYLVFVVRPWTKNLPRAVQKPFKVYFFDNADVIGDEGARFENLVATTLLKKNHFIEDSQGYTYDLAYIRDKEKREVDFAVIKEGKIEALIEAKYSETSFSTALGYYAEKLRPKVALQIVATLRKPFSKGGLVMESPFETLSKWPP